ncbi:helix-turn-helix domain-containing protein [Nesterenkonia pannonica]|uniref:IclR family transcriptional regulator n=1 Tax=Nesterenkonia pannonica TaxID=1548602 RepID=UPI002164B13B|nr:helix-turn-helix domain-containing protein [Nesterenkonia pannonica]
MPGAEQSESVLARHLRVLDAFNMDAAFLTLSQIAARTQLPVSTVHRLIGILEHEKLVERMPDRSYRLGIRLWELASRTPGALGLREIAMPFMQWAHNQVRQHVQLGVMSEYDVLFLERLSARSAVVNATVIGGRIPLPPQAAAMSSSPR